MWGAMVVVEVVVDCGFNDGGGKDRRLGCEVEKKKLRSPNLSS